MRSGIVLLKYHLKRCCLIVVYVSLKSQYRLRFCIRPLHICKSPMQWAIMYPFTITDSAFCTFHWYKVGWSSSSLTWRNVYFLKTSWNVTCLTAELVSTVFQFIWYELRTESLNLLTLLCTVACEEPKLFAILEWVYMITKWLFTTHLYWHSLSLLNHNTLNVRINPLILESSRLN